MNIITFESFQFNDEYIRKDYDEKLNELKLSTPNEYYDVLDNMYADNSPEMLQMIKYFDSTFPKDSKTIYKTDDDNLFIQYAINKSNMYNGPGLYILGMASKTKKMNRKSLQDMYEVLDIFKDMIYPGLNIFTSVNNNTEPLIKRLTNIIKEKDLRSNQQILAQHDFGSEPEDRYKTYRIMISESMIKTFENFNSEETYTMYHGSSKENEERLLNEGFKPYGSCSGGQCGNPAYLYLSMSPESANWFACQKGNDGSVIEVKNIPKSYLGVDPEDGLYVIENDLDKELEAEGSFILKKPLSVTHFNQWEGELTVTGCN